MALIVESGVFPSPSTEGVVQYPLTAGRWGSEAPKLLIIQTAVSTDLQTYGTAFRGFGAGISPTERAAISATEATGVSTTANASGHNWNRVIESINQNGTIYESANLAGFYPARFDLEWAVAQSFGSEHQWTALGGSDLTNLSWHNLKTPSTTGPVRVECGFEPTFAIFYGIGQDFQSPQTFNDSQFGIGLSDFTTHYGMYTASRGAAVQSEARRTQSESLPVLSGWNTVTNQVPDKGYPLTPDSTGFDVQFTEADTTQRRFFVIAGRLETVTAFVVNEGTASVPIGFEGLGAFLLSAVSMGSGVVLDGRYFSGMTDGSANLGMSAFDETGAPTNTNRINDNSNAVVFLGTNSAVAARATASFGPTDLLLNWTQTTGANNRLAGLVFGASAVQVEPLNMTTASVLESEATATSGVSLDLSSTSVLTSTATATLASSLEVNTQSVLGSTADWVLRVSAELQTESVLTSSAETSQIVDLELKPEMTLESFGDIVSSVRVFGTTDSFMRSQGTAIAFVDVSAATSSVLDSAGLAKLVSGIELQTDSVLESQADFDELTSLSMATQSMLESAGDMIATSAASMQTDSVLDSQASTSAALPLSMATVSAMGSAGTARAIVDVQVSTSSVLTSEATSTLYVNLATMIESVLESAATPIVSSPLGLQTDSVLYSQARGRRITINWQLAAFRPAIMYNNATLRPAVNWEAASLSV